MLPDSVEAELVAQDGELAVGIWHTQIPWGGARLEIKNAIGGEVFYYHAPFKIGRGYAAIANLFDHAVANLTARQAQERHAALDI